MRIFALLTLIFALAACRSNLPRNEDTQAQSAQTNKPAAVENTEAAVTRIPQSSEPPSGAGGSYLAGDGPGTGAPGNLAAIPNAVPRDEPLHRYANRPYTVLGKTYTPLTETGHYKKRGVASWYGKKFHGQRTSIGEIYDMYGMTAASTTLPIPSYARVTNLANQKSIIVRINDRGPFLHERIIDLSYTAAAKLDLIGHGQGEVEVESLKAGDYSTAPISPIYREPLQVSPLPAVTPPATAKGEVYLQLGAFNSQRGAEEFLGSMRTKLNETGKQLSLSKQNGMVKVRIGPYANIDAARATALELKPQLGFKPMLVF
jgi:rare lipoprotein A